MVQVERCKTDINDYHRQIEQHRDSLMTQHGGDTELRSKLSEKNKDLNRYLDEIRVSNKRISFLKFFVSRIRKGNRILFSHRGGKGPPF